MIYVFDFETTKNTPESSKAKTILALQGGVVYRLQIRFPPGPSHLLHLKINRGLHQVWPNNPDADFADDDTVITFDDRYRLLTPPFQFEAYTWNTDTVYDHRIIIQIGLEPFEELMRLTPEELAAREE